MFYYECCQKWDFYVVDTTSNTDIINCKMGPIVYIFIRVRLVGRILYMFAFGDFLIELVG